MTGGLLSHPLGSVRSMRNHDTLVYGEHLEDLRPALEAVRKAASIQADGSVAFSVVLEPSVGRPLQRALMRAEAEVLLAEADAPLSERSEERTPEQRAADALVRLAEAILAGCSSTQT